MFYTLSEKTVKKYSEDDAVSQALALIRDKGKEIDIRYLPNSPSKEVTLTLEEVNKIVTRLFNHANYV